MCYMYPYNCNRLPYFPTIIVCIWLFASFVTICIFSLNLLCDYIMCVVFMLSGTLLYHICCVSVVFIFMLINLR